MDVRVGKAATAPCRAHQRNSLGNLRHKSPRLKRLNGRNPCPNFEPANAVAPFAGPFLGPVEPVFLEAERLVRRVA